MNQIKKHKALVTGGARVIGLARSNKPLEYGNEVHITGASINHNSQEEVIKEYLDAHNK